MNRFLRFVVEFLLRRHRAMRNGIRLEETALPAHHIDNG